MSFTSRPKTASSRLACVWESARKCLPKDAKTEYFALMEMINEMIDMKGNMIPESIFLKN